MTKPTGRKRGRPRTLVFNPNIPPIMNTTYAEILPAVQKAIFETQAGNSTAGLLWLNAYNSVFRIATKLHPPDKGSLVGYITTEEQQMLLWLRHKGKHNWEVAQ